MPRSGHALRRAADSSWAVPGPYRDPLRYHPCVISTAYLRVYLADDPAGFALHVESGADERVVRSDGRFVWDEPMTEDAFVTTWHGVTYACPRHTRLRMVEGVLAFSGSFPKIPLVTEDEREILKNELATHRSANRRSHILASAWHVPLRWFGAFSASEREIYDRADGIGIRYRTGMGEAVDRVGWAVRVLDDAGFPAPVIEQVRDLERWLAEFPAGSMLELDYGTVADDITDGDLTFDESAADVRESIEALERGDGAASRSAYTRVARRWAGRQALTFAN